LSSRIEHITPNLEEWPITRFYNKRGEFIKALNEYTFTRLAEKNTDIVSVLEKTIYMEKERVKLRHQKRKLQKQKSWFLESSIDMQKKLLVVLLLKLFDLQGRL